MGHKSEVTEISTFFFLLTVKADFESINQSSGQFQIRHAPCLVHGRSCSIRDSVASIHVAGTPCVAFSSIGALQKEESISFIHFLIWLALRKLMAEPVVVQECVVGFPREYFLRYLPEYEWTFAVVTPTELGWPIHRDRQWVVSET